MDRTVDFSVDHPIHMDGMGLDGKPVNSRKKRAISDNILLVGNKIRKHIMGLVD